MTSFLFLNYENAVFNSKFSVPNPTDEVFNPKISQNNPNEGVLNPVSCL